ncbi:MAG: hypothetical protein JW902_05040 [Syntrophaceae bacterium]|nr:hypothetical protein [Syntrophaceae bacterium]
MSQPNDNVGARRIVEDLLVGLCGFVTSLITAVVLCLIELWFGFAFYSLTFWFIIPVGALLSGFAGATGYLAGARLFNHRPTPLLLLNIVLVSVGTFFVIHYLSYITLKVDGQAVSDYVSFGQYLDIAIRSTSMEFRFRVKEIGATGELGGWGYGVAILQILGFAVGGLAVYGYLESIPYCKRCLRYFSAKGKQTRYTGDAEELQASTVQVLSDFSSGVITSAIEKHRMFGSHKFQKDNHLRSVIEVRHCKKCGQHWVKYVVEKRSGNDWKEISDLTTASFTDQVVDI